ncbi:MAG: transposase domain-containing protein [Sphaerochaetaceae bacterium]|nr:transposase domain-containing protein [Sphaerochaetaceae bacterium]
MVLKANAFAFYYSLVESCKALEIDPFVYITHVPLNARSVQTDEQWDSFLPFRVDLSETKAYLGKINAATPNLGRMEPYILQKKGKDKLLFLKLLEKSECKIFGFIKLHRRHL